MRILAVTSLAVALTFAAGGAALAECSGHSAQAPTTTASTDQPTGERPMTPAAPATIKQ